MIGRTLGNYRIIEQIGLGGMATVYKAYDPDMDRYVAVKVLPQQFSSDPQFRERFEREAKAIAKLEHIHILPIFAYGEEDNIPYMVMRYVPGGTLTDRIGDKPMPFAEASRFLTQLASALDYAHAHGILHRDMKPRNVLLDDAGNAYLMDFGIAKIMEATVDLTGDRLLGTPAYMSPEQCKGEPVGPASDIYSLGIILYEMVTGIRPFHAETPVAVIMQQLNDPLPPPRKERPDLPEKAENAIFKALAKKPESRYKTAGDLATAFAQAITEADTVVAVTTPETDLTPTAATIAQETAVSTKKRRVPLWVWGLVGLVLVAILIAAGWLLSNMDGANDEIVESDTAVAAPGQLVFIQEREDTWQFYATDIDSGKNTYLFEFPKSEFTIIGSPRWSPDGQRILFNADPGKNIQYLYTVNVDGTDLTPILQDIENNLVDAAWSPDGEWLAMHAGCALWIARVDGSQIIEAIDPNEHERCAVYPVWSPDSQQIVYTEHGWETNVTPRLVRVINRDGSNLKTLATIEESRWGPSNATWSPDGTQVAYLGSQDEGSPAFIVNADGSGEAQRIAEIPPSWFPDFWPQWSGENFELLTWPIDEHPAILVCPEGTDLLLAEDFESGNLAQWEIADVQGQPSSAGWEVVQEDDGNHVFAGIGHNWAYAHSTMGNNYILSLRLHENPETPDANYHINMRLGENGRYYISDNQILRDPVNHVLAEWDSRADDDWHNIHIETIGNHIEVFWDDELVATIEDPEPVFEGIFALENTGGVVFYDDILLCALP